MPDYIVEAIAVCLGYMMLVFGVMWGIDWIVGLLRDFGDN